MSASDGLLITSDPGETRRTIATARRHAHTVGCVPTMGALHAGHLSLIQRARRETGFVAVTIFVNPTQFGPGEDLSRYPRPIEADLGLCRDAHVDLVFLPEASKLYPPGFSTWVEVEGMSNVLEGSIRPGHFRGVTTVVLKLLNIIEPDVAFFGQKDYQQQTMIRRMVRDLDLPVQIVVGETIREADGLALSSRNVYLSAKERKSALTLHESLQHAAARLRDGESDIAAVAAAMHEHLASKPGVIPNYAVIVDAESLAPLTAPQPRMALLVAARVGSTRLIDNLVVELAYNPPAT